MGFCVGEGTRLDSSLPMLITFLHLYWHRDYHVFNQRQGHYPEHVNVLEVLLQYTGEQSLRSIYFSFFLIRFKSFDILTVLLNLKINRIMDWRGQYRSKVSATCYSTIHRLTIYGEKMST